MVGAGFNEILNNSLTKAAYYAEEQQAQLVKIMNPLSSDLNVMRGTLLYGGLESVEHNVKRKNPNCRFFEFGNVYSFDPAKENQDDPMQAYKEQYHMGLWLTGKRVEGSWAHANEDTSFAELDAHVDNIKKLQKKFDIDTPVYYAELNWTALMKVIRKQKVEFTDIPKFPSVSRDLALLIDKSVEFQQIEDIARQTERKFLKKVELFDVYEGDKLPAGKKSYAVNFILQDPEKTMGDKQIEAIMQKLIQNLKKQLNAELR